MPQELTSRYLYKWNENLYMFIQNLSMNIHNGFILVTLRTGQTADVPQLYSILAILTMDPDIFQNLVFLLSVKIFKDFEKGKRITE